MRKTRDSFSRRNFLKNGLNTLGFVAGTLAANSAFAKVLKLETPRQTIGPFFPDDGDPVSETRENLDFRLPISEANDNDLTFINGHSGKANGQVINIRGKVLFQDFEGTVNPQVGAVIIMWNASNSGRYNHRRDTEATRFKHPETGEWVERKHDENFQYWGRCITDKEGNYSFKTIVPGTYPVDLESGWFRPPHLHFMATAPAMPQLVTQLYFKGSHINNSDFIQKLNAKDGILRTKKFSKEEQESLIVEYRPDPTGKIKNELVGNYDFVLSF